LRTKLLTANRDVVVAVAVAVVEEVGVVLDAVVGTKDSTWTARRHVHANSSENEMDLAPNMFDFCLLRFSLEFN
jgi:hypothetical protein